MGINFLDFNNRSTIKNSLSDKYKDNDNLLLRKIIYYILLLLITCVGFLLILRIFFSSYFLWLQGIDVIFYLFIFLDLVVLRKYLLQKVFKYELFWFYTFLCLFAINYIWYLGGSFYKDLNIYGFQTELNSFLLLIGFIYLPKVRRIIDSIFIKARQAKNSKKNINSSKREILKLPEKIIFIVTTVAVLMAILYFAISPNLGNFLTVDEHRWVQTESKNPPSPSSYKDALNRDFINASYERSIGYWDAYLSGNVADTFNNANPSATTSFIHLPAYLLREKISFNSYLYVARLSMLAHAILMLFIIFHSVTISFGRRVGLIVFTLLGLSPFFIGYSILINHDSIQGLYGIAFLLYFWSAFKYQKRKYFYLSGIFLSLAILTQFKSMYLLPMLWGLPMILSYIDHDKNYLNIFILNFKKIFSGVLITAIVVLPAILVYPQIFVRRFLFYPNEIFFIVTVSLMFIMYRGLTNKNFLDSFFTIFNKIEKVLVRIIVLSILIVLLVSIIKTNYIFEEVFNYSRIVNFHDALLGSFAVLFYSLPLVLLIFAIIWIYKYFKHPKIDYPFILISLFFLLIVFGIYSTQGTTNGQSGYLLMDTKYLYVLLPLFITGIVAAYNWNKMLTKYYAFLILIILSAGFYANYRFDPFFIHYNNKLLPSGYLITRTTWAIDTQETIKYINNNFSNSIIYNPRGQIENFLNSDMRMLPWYSRFWEYDPDYIIIEWEKTHMYAKIFDFYRENLTPIWSIERNGAIYTAIYLFDQSINYEEILEK